MFLCKIFHVIYLILDKQFVLKKTCIYKTDVLLSGLNYVTCHLKDVSVSYTNMMKVEVLMEFPYILPLSPAHI